MIDSPRVYGVLAEFAGPAARAQAVDAILMAGASEVLLAASAEELEGVPGVPPKTARRIYQQLHRAGRA